MAIPNPFGVFASAFLVSAFAGLAALLRSDSKINVKSIFSALLNSGCLGLAISLCWYSKFSDNIFSLVGICLLAGLGGNTLKATQSGGLKIGTNSSGGPTLEQETKQEKKR
jgi:hypothetical protein